jgi:hypothetical protein
MYRVMHIHEINLSQNRHAEIFHALCSYTYNIGVAAFPIFVRTRLPNCMKGIVDGNYRVEIYVHLLDLTRKKEL